MIVPASTVRRVTRQMRQALVISVVILLALGIDLALFPGSTDRYFSWPIQPSLTASVLAACYLSASLILILALRGMVWAAVKVVLPGGIAFSALATVATLVHFDKFNQDSSFVFARVITWVWLVAYLILPPILLVFWPGQLRAPGDDPSRDAPSSWLRPAVGGAGIVMLVTGLALFIAPQRVAEIWPWAITPLTGRVLGAWVVGLGLVFGVAAASNDRMQMRAPVAGLGALGALELVALVRHGGDVTSGAAMWLFIGFLVACLGIAAAGLRQVWARYSRELGRE